MEVESQVELYDSDLAKIREVFHKLNSKYAGQRDTKDNLLSLVHEAEDLFRGAGFQVSVAMSKQIAYAMGTQPTSDMPEEITFSIDDRIREEEFDYEKMAWETDKLLIPDGVAKKFLDQGGTESQKTDVESEVAAPEHE